MPQASHALARVCIVVLSLALLAAVPPSALAARRPVHRPAVRRHARQAALDPVARAILWAEHRRGSAAWAWYCERFVENAFMTGGRYETAWEAALGLGLRTGPAPRGALVFFRPDPTNRGYGHVGISLGRGRMISALARVTETQIAGSRYWSGLYAGWARVPASWWEFDSWSSSQRLRSSP